MTFEQTKEVIAELDIARPGDKSYKYACIIWHGLNNGWNKRKLNRDLPWSAYYINRCIRKLTYNGILKDGVMYMESGIDKPLEFVLEFTLITLLCSGEVTRHIEEPQVLIPQFAESLIKGTVPFVPTTPTMQQPYEFFIPYDVR